MSELEETLRRMRVQRDELGTAFKLFTDEAQFVYQNGFKLRDLFNAGADGKQFFASLGANSIVDRPCYPEFFIGTSIGDNTHIGPGAYIADTGKITIGNNVKTGAFLQLYTANHPVDIDLRDEVYTKPITIEDNVQIGDGAIVLQGVTIGKGSKVLDCTVVNADIPANTVVAGCPAREVPNDYYDMHTSSLRQYQQNIESPHFSRHERSYADFDYSAVFNMAGEARIIPNIWSRGSEGLQIGQDCFINCNSVFDARKGIELGDRVYIGPYSQFYSALDNHVMGKVISAYGLKNLNEGITVEPDVWFGGSVVVLPGVKIGSGSIIAAGSEVIENIPNNVIAGGRPAEVLKYL